MRNTFLSKALLLAVAALGLMACQNNSDDVQEIVVSSKPIPGSPEDFKANVKDRVFFALNKSHLTPAERATIRAQSDWLKAYPQTSATIEGHADQRGSREYNLALGNRRAASAKAGLVKDGVSADRLKTISFGKDKPTVMGNDESAWAQQRTAITVIN